MYMLGQMGIFDDGTRGIAGGNLLGGSTRGNSLVPAPNPASPNYSTSDAITEYQDADGDVRMSGVNKIRAKWVSRKELERRRTAGLCIRCGNPGHRTPNCTQLTPLRPETAVKSAHVAGDNFRTSDELQNLQIETESLKD